MDKGRRAISILLQDMRSYAEKALLITQGLAPEEFFRNETIQLAVVRCLEVIGEAAGALDKGFQDSHPQIPWRAIIGMRHRMIHGYFDIDLELCWRTVTDDLPPLVDELSKII